tara:strand:+ start:306 stop:530 length:225 start_codon:yes stop_codon:yes gene_type:complete
MKKRDIARFIIEKIGGFPFSLVRNNKSRPLKVAVLFFNFFWFVIIMTIFIPYFFYAMTMEIINDFLDDNDSHKK